MAYLARLQDFGEPPAEPEPFRIEDTEAYRAGYEAGLAEASAASDRAKGAMIDRLAELTFVYAEARQEVMTALSPLFETMSKHLLQAAAPRALVADLADCLRDEAETLAGQPLAVRLAPATAAALDPLLPEELARRIAFVHDADVPDLAVVIGRARGERIIDRGRLINRIADLLDAFTDHIEEQKAHG